VNVNPGAHAGDDRGRPLSRRRPATGTNVLTIIEKLEELVTNAKRVPLSGRAMIDEDDFLALIDQLRVAYPEELNQAKLLANAHNTVISATQAEADKIIDTARREAARMTEDTEIVRLSREQAEAIIAEAEQQADELLNGADEYAAKMLGGLGEELSRILAQIKRGESKLEHNREAHSQRQHPQTDPDQRAV
jgi:cell division septum initiation protein DivIVA